MKISSIKTGIQNFATKIKIAHEEAFLNSCVSIHGKTMDSDTFNQLYNARKMIANSIAEEGICLNIYSAGKWVRKDSANPGKMIKEDKIAIIAEDIIGEEKAERIINADTKATYPHIEEDCFQVNKHAGEIQYSRLARHRYEDPFLRYVYRTVIDLVEELKSRRL